MLGVFSLQFSLPCNQVPETEMSLARYARRYNQVPPRMLRVHDLSGSVARHLSGRHSAPKGVPNETNGSATGEPKDEIRRNV